MIRRCTLTGLALLIAAPLVAQAPPGMQMRVDRSTNAADPDDEPEVTVETTEHGFEAYTGPAAVFWTPESTATGSYTLSGTFTLIEPSGHVNYYGLVFGGDALEGDGQNYLYFLVAQNGTYIVKHRAGTETHNLVGRTPHDAVAQPGDDGSSVNLLQVRVGDDEIQFVVNDAVVHTEPKAGMASRTDGFWGVRINHRIPGLRVEGLSVSH
jgi:hypothetical protein